MDRLFLIGFQTALDRYPRCIHAQSNQDDGQQQQEDNYQYWYRNPLLVSPPCRRISHPEGHSLPSSRCRTFFALVDHD